MLLEKVFENISIIKTNIKFDTECRGITENSRRVSDDLYFVH